MIRQQSRLLFHRFPLLQRSCRISFSSFPSSLLQQLDPSNNKPSNNNAFGAFTSGEDKELNENAKQYRETMRKMEQKQAEQDYQKKQAKARQTRTLLLLSSIVALMTTLTFSAYIYMDDLKNGPLHSKLDNLKRILNGGSYRDYVLLDDPRRVILGEGIYHYKDDRQSFEEFTEQQAKSDGTATNIEQGDFSVQKNFEFKLRLPKEKFIGPGVIVQDQLDAVGSAGTFSMADDFGNVFAANWVLLDEVDAEAAKTQPKELLDKRVKLWTKELMKKGFECRGLEVYPKSNTDSTNTETPYVIVHFLDKNSLAMRRQTKQLDTNVKFYTVPDIYMTSIFFIYRGNFYSLGTQYPNNLLNLALAKQELQTLRYPEEEIRKRLGMETKEENSKQSKLIQDWMQNRTFKEPHKIMQLLEDEVVEYYHQFLQDNK